MATFIFPSVNDVHGSGSVGDAKTLREKNINNIIYHASGQRNRVIEDYTVSAASGLNVNVSCTSTTGKAIINGWYVEDDVDFTSQSVTASATNYVYLAVSVDGSGNATDTTITINTTGTAPSNSVLLAIAVTGASTVTSVTDKRRFPRGSQYGCLLYKTDTQSIPNTTSTAILWNAEVYDDSSFHDLSTNTSRITIPEGVSRVRLTASFAKDASTLGTTRYLEIWKNGSSAFTGSNLNIMSSSTTGWPLRVQTAILEVTPGDYFEAAFYHDRGSSATFGGNATYDWFSCEVIE